MTESNAKLVSAEKDHSNPNKPIPQEFAEHIERIVAEMLRRKPDMQKH